MQTIFLATYETHDELPVLPLALVNQTSVDWRLLVVSDGVDKRLVEYIKQLEDARFGALCTNHHYRDRNAVITLGLDWINDNVEGERRIVITSAHNYYAPFFVELTDEQFTFNKGVKVVSTGCSSCHNHHAYTKPDFEFRQIDLATTVIDRVELYKVGWQHSGHDAAWYFMNDLAKSVGVDKWHRLENDLVTVNR